MPNMRPNLHSAAPSVRPAIHNAAASVRPTIHSAAPSVRPNIHSAAPSVRPTNIPPTSNSQYPSNIPFPSLSGVTTVTKKEFNNASDSIQVDGSCDVIASEDDVPERNDDVTRRNDDVTKRNDDGTEQHNILNQKLPKTKPKRKQVNTGCLVISFLIVSLSASFYVDKSFYIPFMTDTV